jgi:uroporphyrinogen decarboxylase
MDKIERVRGALEGKPVDRVPFSLFYHFSKPNFAGERMAKAHIEYYRSADPDFLKVMNDNYYSPPGLRGLKKPSDWRALRPAPPSSKCFQDQLSGLRKIVEVLGDETLVITTVFNPFHDADGMSDWTASSQLAEYPEAVDEGLSTVADSLSSFAKACVEAGAHGIYFAAHGGGRGSHSRRDFEKFIKPHDLRVLSAAKDAGATFNVLHACGKDLRLGPYADYPSHAVNWAPQSGNLSLREGRRLFNRTMMGGLDQAGPILTGTEKEVTQEVERAIDGVGDRGFILGAGCALARKVPPERILWVRDALESRREHRRRK